MKEKKAAHAAPILERHFPPMPLRRADLDDVLSRTRSWGLKARFSDDEFEYESLDEMADNRDGRVALLNVDFVGDYKGERRRLRLTIDGTGVQMRCSNQPSLLPLWDELCASFARRVPWYARFMRPLEWLVAGSLFVAFWAGAPAARSGSVLHGLTLASLAAAALIGAVTLASLLYRIHTRMVRLSAQPRPGDTGLAAATRYLQQGAHAQSLRERITHVALGLVLGFLGGLLTGRMGIL